MSKYNQIEKWDFCHQLMFKYMHVFKYKIITISSNWAFLIRYIKETPTMKLLMLQFNYKPFCMPVHLHYYFCCQSWSVACCLMQFTMLYFLYKKNFHSFCLSAIYGKAWTHKRWYITVIKVEEKNMRATLHSVKTSMEPHTEREEHIPAEDQQQEQ